jgi:hypothetical protein
VDSRSQPVESTRPAARADEEAQIARILASEPFRRSAKLRDFLRYIAERTFCHDQDSITEQQIGISVFGREPGYNPGDDSVVRVQARHLREKLAEYFATEGSADPVLVTVPKGRYVPLFTTRPAPSEPATPGSPSPSPAVRWWLVALACTLAFAAGIWVRPLVLPLPSAQRDNPPMNPLLAAVLQPGTETSIVLEDMGLLFSGSFRAKGEIAGLDDYRQGRYMPDIPPLFRDEALGRRVERNLAPARFVAYANANFVFRLARAYPGPAAQATARFPRDIHVRDIKNNNLILLGGATDNPWVGLYEDRLNFPMRYFLPGNGFANRAPRGTEPSTFGVASFPQNPPYFARVALLPNMQAGRRVLMLTGMGTAATESASEFVLSPALADRLPAEVVTALRHPEGQVEILLKCEPVLEAPYRMEVAAWRVAAK